MVGVRSVVNTMKCKCGEDVPKYYEKRKEPMCSACDLARLRKIAEDTEGGPCCDSPVSHFGYSICRSGAYAAPGGWRTHCTCDGCF
jgi:hypothetical protein